MWDTRQWDLILPFASFLSPSAWGLPHVSRSPSVWNSDSRCSSPSGRGQRLRRSQDLELNNFKALRTPGIGTSPDLRMGDFPLSHKKTQTPRVCVPLSRPDLVPADIAAVARVLRTPFLSMGPRVIEFERNFARFIGLKYAVAMNSGTSALHACMHALGIGPGDEVITTPFSFIASANSILFRGATPVFVDIDATTLNMNPALVEEAVSRKTRAILVVHIFGLPCEMDEIMRIAHKHKLEVIEDACEAIGATYHGRKVGTFGRAAVFAFYPNKQMTTGEGGMVVTDDERYAAVLASIRNQGRSAHSTAWLEHERLGYNFRMDEMSAALGISQLRRLPSMLAARRRVANEYARRLNHLPGVQTLVEPRGMKRSWFVYVIRFASHDLREAAFEHLTKKGIQCGKYFPPIHLQPFYVEQFGYSEGMFPVCEAVSKSVLALPFYNNISARQIDLVVRALEQVCGRR